MMKRLVLTALGLIAGYGAHQSPEAPSRLISQGPSAMAPQPLPQDSQALAELEQALTQHLAQSISLAELHNWLSQHNQLEAVTLSNAIIKTEPPQREFRAIYQGSPDEKKPILIDVFLLPDESLQLSDVRYATTD